MSFPSRSRLATALGLAFGCVVARLPILLSSPRVIEPEELYVGTIANELALGNAPVGFFELQYGHHDFGSLVNGVLARGLFSILPPNAATLQLVGLFFACIALVASVYVAQTLAGKRAAVATALLLLLPPPFLLRAQLSAQGNHAESIAFLMVAIALMVSAGATRRSLALGAVLGFGMTYDYILVPFAAGLALFPWVRPPRTHGRTVPSIRGTVALGIGLLVGAGPWAWSASVADHASPAEILETTAEATAVVTHPSIAGMTRAARKGAGLYTRDLRATFRTRWPAHLPLGARLDSGARWGEAGREPEWTKAASVGDNPTSIAETRSADVAGLAWYLLGIGSLAGLVYQGIRRRRGTTADGLVIALPLAGFTLAWALTRYGVEDLALRIYGDDEYLAYRYLAPATHLLLLALGIAIGKASGAASRSCRVAGHFALCGALVLGSAATAAYLDDTEFPWNPTRVPAMAAHNYGPLGRKIAADSRGERARDLQQYMANQVVDLRRWSGFQRLAEWTALRPGSAGRSMAAHYGWALLQDDIPSEFAAAWLSQLHSLCPGLGEDARRAFCRNLHAGVPPDRGPAPSPPLPSKPHPKCIPSTCCRPAPSPARPRSDVSPSPDAPRPITTAKAIPG